MLKSGDIVAVPGNLVMRVVEVSGQIIRCKFLLSPIEKVFNESEVRYLSTNEQKQTKEPVRTHEQLVQIITDRNKLISDIILDKRSKRGIKQGNMVLELSKSSSDDEFQAILNRYGIKIEREVDTNEEG